MFYAYLSDNLWFCSESVAHVPLPWVVFVWFLFFIFFLQPILWFVTGCDPKSLISFIFIILSPYSMREMLF